MTFLGILAAIRSYWKMAVAVVVAAIPLLTYMVGRNHAAANAQKALLREKLAAEKSRADFYKRFNDERDQANRNAPRNHDDWIDRMRDGGF